MGDLMKFRPRRRKQRERWLLRWAMLLVAGAVLLAPATVLNALSPLTSVIPPNVRENLHNVARQALQQVEVLTGWNATTWMPRTSSRQGATRQRAAYASSLRGRAEVVDGDSLRLRGVDIRLHGIDAPEFRQTCRDSSGRSYACGKRATAHLRKFVGQREITCHRITTDRHGRMVARCTLPNGEDIGQHMVRDGWAVAFVRYSRAYVSDERAARAARRGMWSGRFIPPAAWRRTQRQ